MVKITEAASLAYHAMALLAATTGVGLTTAHIAQRLGASENHLAKVMQRLVHARLARSRRGPLGGFQLARAAGDITLLQIHEAIEGAWQPQDCLLPARVCQGSCCLLGARIQELDREVRAHLERTRLADMCAAFAGQEAP